MTITNRRGTQARTWAPFALLGELDVPAVLAHAKTEAATAGVEEFALLIPMINAAAVSYLLALSWTKTSSARERRAGHPIWQAVCGPAW